MKLINKILDIIDYFKAKRIQRILIRTNDDEKIIEALPPDEDNSKIDIHEVVKNMKDPENKVEVVANKMPEIIEQNVVRDTLKDLPDKEAVTIIKEHQNKLEEYQKMKFAIQAIKSNERKLKLTEEYVKSLTDFDLGDIFKTLKPEKDEEEKSRIEQMKVRIISKKILADIKKYGTVSHFNELTEGLEDRAKLSVLNLSLEGIQSEKLKVKLIRNLLCKTDIDYDKKNIIIEEYKNKALLTEESEAELKEELLVDKAEQEEQNGEGRG